MKKIILSIILLSVLSLSGCKNNSRKDDADRLDETSKTAVGSRETSLAESSEQSQESQVTQEGALTTSSQAEESNGEPEFTGNFYTVPGKYGPIIVVNKKHPLAASYAPGEDPTALAEFQRLVGDMQVLGFSVSNSYSGFRSYETQAELYQNYVNRDGQAAADRYSARPGYSEHQTGLAFDLLDSSGNLLTEPSAAAWLRENAARYGFIVRYIEGKEAVTGYMAEAWHIRYIGEEAQEIAASGLTLEEYFGVAGGDYED